jgi:hypothetical protein
VAGGYQGWEHILEAEMPVGFPVAHEKVKLGLPVIAKQVLG